MAVLYHRLVEHVFILWPVVIFSACVLLELYQAISITLVLCPSLLHELFD